MNDSDAQVDPRPPGSPQSAVGRAWSSLHKPVFLPASAIIIGLIVFCAVYGAVGSGDPFGQLNEWITDGVGWWYILVSTGFVLFAVVCAATRIGNIRLGRDDEEPEFGVLSWFAMLFSAGMGIGLVFYGAAEPLSHYLMPPEAGGVEGGTDAAARQAMELTLFHWGFHAWAIYVVVGLGLAYMTFRRGRPLSVRWLLEPLLGRKRIEGPIGHIVDVVAIVGTLFGVATSLGFGVQQIMSGLEYLDWLQRSNPIIVGLIAAITAIATFSVVSGVNKGLKWLSNINMVLAACLAVFVLLVGPTLFLLQSWVENTGGYIQAFPDLMLRTAPFSDDGWAGSWTIFYWGWWISWAPFVGMFIARISRGRTIRQFVVGVLLAPTMIATVWFTIFGDTSILRQRDDGDMLSGGEVSNDTALFQMLDGLPLGIITSVLAIAVIVFFFVTSSDSGSLVIDILSTGGDIDTPKITRVYWALLEGIAAAVLLLVGGSASLTALQTVSIATAVPFSIVMVLACIALLKAFRYEVATMPRYVRVRRTATPEAWRTAEYEDADAGSTSPHTEQRPRRGISATFAGLGQSRPGHVKDPADDQVVLAVHAVPSQSVEVNAATGHLNVADDTNLTDPIAGEVFDTAEYAESAEGHAHQARQSGTTPD